MCEFFGGIEQIYGFLLGPEPYAIYACLRSLVRNF